jgi:hypothetical protein
MSDTDMPRKRTVADVINSFSEGQTTMAYRKSSRATGTNPRAVGTNPRANTVAMSDDEYARFQAWQAAQTPRDPAQVAKIDELIALCFAHLHPDDWNFAASLAGQFKGDKGALSEKQWPHVDRLLVAARNNKRTGVASPARNGQLESLPKTI